MNELQAMRELLAAFKKARKELQEARQAWQDREKQQGLWLPILDRYKAAEKEEQELVNKILDISFPGCNT